MNNKVIIIAEAGVNHNGSLELAKKLVDAAYAAGADAVKFQTFKADKLVSRSASKAEYQIATTGDKESQYEMIKNLELDEAAHLVLVDYCKTVGIEFLSTPFDSESLLLLANKLNLSLIKIPSGEITNAPFLLEIAQTGKPVILSTGMSTIEEVETALGIIAFGYLRSSEMKPSPMNFSKAYASDEGKKLLADKVIVLHCTTEYPAPFSDINLNAMVSMKKNLSLPVGYSDHSTGISIPIAAVALGARVIEKHFTLDRSMPGPDHKASLEPEELKLMVKSIREVELAMGSFEKKPAPSEIKNRQIARKSLVAATKINKGEVFTTINLVVKRPGDGISPANYWEWLGKTATRDYQPDEKVEQ